MSDNLAIIMVGLPATGKSFTSRHLSRYLRWLGIDTFIFSAAKYRQDMLHGHQITANFFDANNSECLQQRTRVADATLLDMSHWFQRESHNSILGLKIAIMDASNTIQERRALIRKTLEEIGVNVIFIECIYETEGLLHEHLPFLHLLSPDYENLNSEIAQEDYKQRITFYRQNYSPVDEADGSFIKLINGGQQLILNNITGFLSSKVIFYLMNLNFQAKKIFLQVNHDELKSDDLIQTCEILSIPDTNLVVWTAPDINLCKTSTKSDIDFKVQLSSLNLANLEGLTDLEISEIYPEEVLKHQNSPFKHRYPQCESYADLSRRLETVMMELEMMQNILIIADISVIRCIYSYFVETSDPNNIPGLKFNSKELIEFFPQAYGCFETRYINGIPSREPTFRPYLDHPPSNFASKNIIM